MGFWIFMTITNLLIPLTMVLFGRYFSKSAPKEINGVFGYRTPMSMKNKETWEFAHHYCGRLWLIIGWIILIASVISMLFVMGKNESIIEKVSSVLCGIQVFLLIGSIFPVERALKKNFDKYGRRKNKN